MNKLIAILSLFAFSGDMTIAAADESAVPLFVPADFATGKRSLENLIEFPEIDFDVEVTVTCAGHANRKGRLKKARCSSPGDPELEFTLAVSRRFNSTRVVPALVKGKPEDVDFQFSVVFTKRGDSENIRVYPNNGKNVERLGQDYISAQRYSPHPFPARCSGWRHDDLILEIAIVNESGSPRDVDVMSSTAGIPARCRQELKTRLYDARWIPASHDGHFVESVWVNPIVLTNVSYRREQ